MLILRQFFQEGGSDLSSLFFFPQNTDQNESGKLDPCTPAISKILSIVTELHFVLTQVKETLPETIELHH